MGELNRDLNIIELYKFCVEKSTIPDNVTVKDGKFNISKFAVEPVDMYIFEERYKDFKSFWNIIELGNFQKNGPKISDQRLESIPISYDIKLKLLL